MTDHDETCLWAKTLSLRFRDFLIVVFDRPAGFPRYKVEGFPSIFEFEERRRAFPVEPIALYQNGLRLHIVRLVEVTTGGPAAESGCGPEPGIIESLAPEQAVPQHRCPR